LSKENAVFSPSKTVDGPSHEDPETEGNEAKGEMKVEERKGRGVAAGVSGEEFGIWTTKRENTSNRFYFYVLKQLQKITFSIDYLPTTQLKSFLTLFMNEISLLSSNYSANPNPNQINANPNHNTTIDSNIKKIQLELFRSLFSLKGFGHQKLNKASKFEILPEILSIIELFFSIFPFNSSNISFDLTTLSAGELFGFLYSFTIICNLLQINEIQELISIKYSVPKNPLIGTNNVLSLLSKNTFDSTIFTKQLLSSLVGKENILNTSVQANMDLYIIMSRVRFLIFFSLSFLFVVSTFTFSHPFVSFLPCSLA
jgi:hypothetical protein